MHHIFNPPRRVLQLAAAMYPLVAFASAARADIFQWEYINSADPSQGTRQCTMLAPDGAGVDAVPGADLSGRELTMAYLLSADVRNANFYSVDLTDANIAGAEVRGTRFDKRIDYIYVCAPVFLCVPTGPAIRLEFGTGISLNQLYSTASYKSHDLSGIGLGANNLAGGNFAGQYFANAFLSAASLVGADFTGADTRGAFINLDDTNNGNLIRPDGHIDGLDLDGGGLLVVRDYDGNPNGYVPTGPIPITIDEHLGIGPGGTLRMVFEADAWDSTISFGSGVPITLGGTLELAFAADVNPASQVGRTLKIFDWTGVNPAGVFVISSPYRWDLSNLYGTGQVTLTSVPEPTSLVPLLVGAVLLALTSRRAYFALAIVVLIVGISPAFADLPMTGMYVPELQEVDTLLQNFMVGKPIPGGTITITHDDKVIYERGIGYSDAARTLPMQETALMRLASVSKPITASAIQQLAKDGQLNLNDKVFNINGNGGLLNITPYNGTLGDSRLRDVTVQHLLEHQGGWNRDTAGDLALRDVQVANAMGVPSPPGIANSARYILSSPLQFTPGTNYNYSNIGYMFLGMVVEEASGQAYERYVENHVLAPAGIPAWEVDAGRTFAVDQNPREPVYSDPLLGQNVYNPTGPSVPWPYGGMDHEKALAFGGLIGSSKAIALLAQHRIANGPEIGKLRSDYTTYSEYVWGHDGSLPGTDTLILQASLKDWTYSILFNRRPSDGSSYSVSLFEPLQNILEGLATWPTALVYAGDFTIDQWLTLDDITLFKEALALGSEMLFTEAYPTARYSAGDFDGDGQVNASDAPGLIGALQHAGVPAEYVALVPELPGDYNRSGVVDAADYAVWRDNVGFSLNLPNEALSLGLVDQADYDIWKRYFGTALGPGSGSALLSAESRSASIPEPSSFLLCAIAAMLVGRRYRR